jgi:xanthine dehydrogenase accessory factor
MRSIAEEAGHLIDRQQEFVLATIVSRSGSAPRTAGTRMIITRGGREAGTIGGGLLEARVIAAAGELFSTRRPVMLPFDLSHTEVAAMDMVCGGQVEVLIELIPPSGPPAALLACWRDALRRSDPCLFLSVVEMAGGQVERVDHSIVKAGRPTCGECPLPPAQLRELDGTYAGATGLRTVRVGTTLILVDPVLKAETVYLFGAGHVAQPTARLAAFAGFRVVVVDDRSEFANAERFPEADEIRVTAGFDSAFDGVSIDGCAFIVILTRGHLYDMTVLRKALSTQAAYVGMIGSRRKRDHIFNALLTQGVTEADLKRVHSPIGLDIGAETPEEIALSIVAELVQVRAERRR